MAANPYQYGWGVTQSGSTFAGAQSWPTTTAGTTTNCAPGEEEESAEDYYKRYAAWQQYYQQQAAATAAATPAPAPAPAPSVPIPGWSQYSYTPQANQWNTPTNQAWNNSQANSAWTAQTWQQPSTSQTTTNATWGQQTIHTNAWRPASASAPTPAATAVAPTAKIDPDVQAKLNLAAAAAMAAVGQNTKSAAPNSRPWNQPKATYNPPQPQQWQWANSTAQQVQQAQKTPLQPGAPSYSAVASGASETTASAAGVSAMFTWNKPKTVAPAAPTPEEAFGTSKTPKSETKFTATGLPSVKEWPSALHDYVQRNFAQCRDATDNAIVEEALRKLLVNVCKEGKLWSTVWVNQPLIELRPINRYRDSRSPSPHRRYRREDDQSSKAISKEKPKLSKKEKKRKNAKGIGGETEPNEKRSWRSKRFDGKGSSSFAHFQPGGGGVGANGVCVFSMKGGAVEEETTSYGELSREPIKGTCTSIEKHYVRTSIPDPATVRPREVLIESLKHVKNQKDIGAEYDYLSDQLRSIRQDLTLQHIRDELTVDTYETHARYALLFSDLSEFNQCQCVLKGLHRDKGSDNKSEFLAYRLLFWVFQLDSSELQRELMCIGPEERDLPEIQHALSVRSAVMLPNYPKLFKLWRTAPNIGSHLLTMFMPQIREKMFTSVMKAHKPVVPILWLSQCLGFLSITDEDFLKFSTKHHFVASAKDSNSIDVKLTTEAMAKAAEAESGSDDD